MKHRSSLVLLELLIMTAVFALAAALCLQIFMEADRISRDTLHRDQAARICQHAAETLKAEGDLPTAARVLGAVEADGCWQFPAQQDFLLELEAQAAPAPGMGSAVVRVCRISDGQILFCLTVGYREVAP